MRQLSDKTGPLLYQKPPSKTRGAPCFQARPNYLFLEHSPYFVQKFRKTGVKVVANQVNIRFKPPALPKIIRVKQLEAASKLEREPGIRQCDEIVCAVYERTAGLRPAPFIICILLHSYNKNAVVVTYRQFTITMNRRKTDPQNAFCNFLKCILNLKPSQSIGRVINVGFAAWHSLSIPPRHLCNSPCHRDCFLEYYCILSKDIL